ncbi:MAG: potassium transporter TrkA, partial [Gemmatimonadota bacterium]|nr:potassium transporter TrkA [Gemmatimonadota bacterium]
DEDVPFHAVRLEDAEARKFGALLGGAYFQPAVAESMEMVLEQMAVEWLKVNDASPLAGQTILESAIRERTGASVIAILRGGRAFPNPQPADRIEPGDTLMVVGSREQVTRFGDLLRGHSQAAR